MVIYGLGVDWRPLKNTFVQEFRVSSGFDWLSNHNAITGQSSNLRFESHSEPDDTINYGNFLDHSTASGGLDRIFTC